MHPRVIDILESAGTEAAMIRPTELYNEGWMLRLILDWAQQHAPEGIVNLTHHKPRQPQDMASKPTPKYSIWGLGPSETS